MSSEAGNRSAMATSLPILIFHTLDDRGSVISFPPEAFRRNLGKLHENGYRTLSLLEAANRVRQGQAFPPRSFVLTFDDGYRTTYDEALPVLQRYDMTATIFITTGESKPTGPAERLPSWEGQSMLSWREIWEMHRWGIDVGAHTCTHPDLTRLPTEQIEAEICTSTAIIENMLGSPVKCLAYPFGRYDSRSREIARRHFACACSDTLSLVTTNSDPYALERLDAYYLRPDGLFDLMLTDWFPWYVHARRISRGIKRVLLSRIG